MLQSCRLPRPSGWFDTQGGRRSSLAAQLGASRRHTKHLVGGTITTAAAQHIILAAPPTNSAPVHSETLLVFAPDLTLAACDMQHLAETVQAQSPDVRLWVACMDMTPVTRGAASHSKEKHPGMTQQQALDTQPASDALQSLLAEVKDAAAAAGFKPRQAGLGRCTNLYLCAQGSAGATLSSVAFKSAAGLILLSSTLAGHFAVGKLPSLEDWGRPVLLLGAELDGQMRWPWSAALASDAAVLAQKAGPRFAAAHQPFILVCGANHAQTSNGAPNYTSGDIPAHTEYAAAADVFARAIGAFITAHEGAGKSSRQAATDELLLMVRQTAELIGPYFMASGMGDLCSAWVTGRQGGPESTASLDAPDTTQHTHSALHPSTHLSSPLQQALLQGARRTAGEAVSAALHPGVVQKAERFVAAAQLRLASTLPRIVLGKLRIVVQTHTTVEALLYNQPIVEEQEDGSVVVLVHALIALPNLVRPEEGRLLTAQPAAPEYWLKLKRPQAVAEELGLSGAFADGTTAAAVNQSALGAALAAVAPPAAARYKASGWQLSFGEDEVTNWDAEGFIWHGAMKYDSTPAVIPAGSLNQQASSLENSQQSLGVMTVRSPVLISKSVGESREQPDQGSPNSMQGATDDPYMRRFYGNWYTKVMSVAQAMEWVMLDSLRQQNLWA